jgi:glycosyltransferase involved in cell wall biosynthesis
MHVIVLADFAIADGGAPKVAIESARALAEQGVAITYIHAVGDRLDPLLDHPGIAAIGLGLADVWSQPIHRAAVNGVWSRAAGIKLRAALTRIARPDSIVHLHQWTKALSPAAFSAIRASGLPLAVTMHDYFLACPVGVFYRFDTHEPCALKPLSAACLTSRCDPRSRAHKAIRVARLLAQNRAIRNWPFDVVHVSDRGARTIAPHLPATVRQHRIDNPVRIAKGPPAEIVESSRMLYLGRFTIEKGAVIAAEAAKRAGVPALFVGEGPAEAAIRAANPRAEIRGWVKPAGIADLIRCEARVLVAPSRWPETGPLTVYEAMAVGVPVIGSDMSGAAEKIRLGETGLIVSPDVAALSAALQTVWPLEAARGMGAEAYRQYWRKPPTPARHGAELAALYQTILSHRAVDSSLATPQNENVTVLPRQTMTKPAA